MPQSLETSLSYLICCNTWHCNWNKAKTVTGTYLWKSFEARQRGYRPCYPLTDPGGSLEDGWHRQQAARPRYLATAASQRIDYTLNKLLSYSSRPLRCGDAEGTFCQSCSGGCKVGPDCREWFREKTKSLPAEFSMFWCHTGVKTATGQFMIRRKALSWFLTTRFSLSGPSKKHTCGSRVLCFHSAAADISDSYVSTACWAHRSSDCYFTAGASTREGNTNRLSNRHAKALHWAYCVCHVFLLFFLIRVNWMNLYWQLWNVWQEPGSWLSFACH